MRRRGFDVRVYEQAPQLRTEGAGLALWANVTAVLDRMGLGDLVNSVGARFDDVAAVTTAGHRISRMDLSGVADRYGAPHIHVHRGELLEALGQAAGDAVVTGSRCVAYRADGNGVTVQLPGGQEEHGEVLIGADGAGSTVRDLLTRRTESTHPLVVRVAGMLPGRPADLPVRSMLTVMGRPTFAPR